MRASVIVAVLVAVFVAATATAATPITLVYPKFTSGDINASSGTLRMNGSATWVSAEYVNLTPNQMSQSGSIWYRDKISLAASRGFSTCFKFNINTTSVPADMVVFSLQNDNTSNTGGLSGSNNVSVEFDTYNNGSVHNDPNANHIGLNVNGSMASLATATPSFTINNAGDVYAWVDYNGTTLEVRVSTSATRPTSATLSYAINLANYIPQSVYTGFYAWTGGSYQYADIKQWYFNDTNLTGGITPSSVTYEKGAHTLSVSTAPSTVRVGNQTTATFLVKDVDGNAMASRSVSLSATGGTLSSATGTTNASGYVTATYTAGPVHGTYSITAVADGASTSTGVTVTAAPPVLGDYSADLLQGAVSGAAVTAVAATDPENLTRTYSITGGNSSGLFAINAATGAITLTGTLPARTTMSAYTLTVTATNSEGYTDTGTVAVRVANVGVGAYATPTLSGVALTYANATSLGVFSASSTTPSLALPNGYALVAGTGRTATADASFSGVIQYRYDMPSSTYPAKLRILHLAGETWEVISTTYDDASGDVYGSVSSLGEFAVAYELTTARLAGSVAHASVLVGAETTVTFTALDALGSPVANTSLTLEAPDGGMLGATSVTTDASGKGTVSFTAPATHGAYRVTAASEGASATVNVSADAAAPRMGDASAVVGEGALAGTNVTSLGASDPEGLALTYEITAGNDAGVFAVDSSGVLKLAATVPGLATTPTYTLSVRATNSEGKYVDGAIHVRVVNAAVGANAKATSGGVSVTFDQVTSPGVLTVTRVTPRRQAPAGYLFVPSGYYDVTADATYTGSFTLTISYDPATIADTSTLKIVHFTGSSYAVLDTAVDPINHTASARASSFSDYALIYSSGTLSTPASSQWTLAIGTLAAISLAAAVRSRTINNHYSE